MSQYQPPTNYPPQPQDYPPVAPCPRPVRVQMKAAALIAFAIAWLLAFMGLQPLAGVAVLASFVLMCFI